MQFILQNNANRRTYHANDPLDRANNNLNTNEVVDDPRNCAAQLQRAIIAIPDHEAAGGITIKPRRSNVNWKFVKESAAARECRAPCAGVHHAREICLYITAVTRIRLLSSLAETICADPCTPARDHTVVCGNKTIPVCRSEVMWAGILGAVWIFYNGLLTCARRSAVLFAYGLSGRCQFRVRVREYVVRGMQQQIAVQYQQREHLGGFYTRAEMMSASRVIRAPKLASRAGPRRSPSTFGYPV